MTGPSSDAAQYAAADRIAEAHRAWLVLWGEWTRLYWAILYFPRPPLALHDADPDRLAAAIRRAERDRRLCEVAG